VEVIPVVRRSAGAGEISWDPERGRIDAARLEGLDAVVHLAGENIAGLWTGGKKRRILESRAGGTRLLADAIARLNAPPRVLVSASGVGIYGDARDAVLTEESPAGDDFLAGVCIAWEDATGAAADAGVRVVRTRFGLVLHPGGGVLARMRPIFRLGLGARLGSGEQWMSWIALADVVRIIEFAIDSERVSGAVNAVAPNPVTNAEFTRRYAASLGRPAFLAVPSAVIRTFTLGMGEALLLASQRAVPTALDRWGYQFVRPSLGDAVIANGVD
jgi:uncharacterized protein (TIGR01777 family)